jgi:putative copper resistance protein D
MMTVGTWDAAVVIARAATYAATLAASGGVFFLIYSHALLDFPCAGRIRLLIRVLALIAVLSDVVMILAAGASMAGDADGLADLALTRMFLQAGEGRASLVRMIGLILIGVSLTARRPPAAVAFLGSVAAATSFVLVGHVHSLAVLRNSWLPAVGSVVHLLGAAFWLGALSPLLIATGGADRSSVAATVRRFGIAALVVVGALLTAGVVLLCLLLRGAGDLWNDDYGRLLLTKILLVSCLLALAAFNHLRLTPRLCAHDEGALRVLKRSIIAELAVAGCVLIATAALTTLTGPPALEMPRQVSVRADCDAPRRGCGAAGHSVDSWASARALSTIGTP